MRRTLSFALAALVIAPAARAGSATHEAWKWERAVLPNAASPGAEQCAVLDADLFARAAPGLRDVRLVQDGRELAYATDISLDDGSGAGAKAPSADRALYEVALVVPAHPSEWAAVAGSGQGRPEHPPGWFYGMGLLPAHVPVERIRLDVPVAGTEYLSMRAAEANRLRDAETLEATLKRDDAAAAFTIGANLQQDAEIRLNANGDVQAVGSFVLEMRRREICYQPLSGSPVTLLFGNPRALPVHYEYARHYQPKAAPLLASMGPARLSPAYRAASPKPPVLRVKAKLLAAILACVLALAFTLRTLLPAKH